jgi:hypothetical protein
MDEAALQQMLDELLSSFEPLEARSAALLQFLKAKGIASDEELAPFLEQAENTSNVRWRALRVRIAALISSAMKPSEQSVEAPAAKKTQPASESSPETTEGNIEKGNAQQEEEVKKKDSQPESQKNDKTADSSSKAGAATVSRNEKDKKENKINESDSHQQKPARDMRRRIRVKSGSLFSREVRTIDGS